MRHPRHCLANRPGFSSNITSAAHLSTPPMSLMLAHYSPYSQWYATHATHARTQPTSPRSATSQMLARHERHPPYPRQHTTHICIPPKLACHPCKQTTTLARHQRKHATHAILFCDFQSAKSFAELNSLLSKLFCYVTWFDERQFWMSCNKAAYRFQP